MTLKREVAPDGDLPFAFPCAVGIDYAPRPMSDRRGSMQRLTEPLVRDGDLLRVSTWDEALGRAARGIEAAVQKHGPSTFGIFSCSKATNEVNYVAQKFIRSVVGSNNIDSCNRT
jgi:formate dehydrogenase major subunit